MMSRRWSIATLLLPMIRPYVCGGSCMANPTRTSDLILESRVTVLLLHKSKPADPSDDCRGNTESSDSSSTLAICFRVQPA